MSSITWKIPVYFREEPMHKIYNEEELVSYVLWMKASNLTEWTPRFNNLKEVDMDAHNRRYKPV